MELVVRLKAPDSAEVIARLVERGEIPLYIVQGVVEGLARRLRRMLVEEKARLEYLRQLYDALSTCGPGCELDESIVEALRRAGIECRGGDPGKCLASAKLKVMLDKLDAEGRIREIGKAEAAASTLAEWLREEARREELEERSRGNS